MLVVIVIAYITAITIINSINPTLERQSRVIAKSLAERISNEAMKEAMQGVKYEDLCNIEKDSELDKIEKISFNANDLIVITVVKKLGAYMIAVTEKSPAKYRGVFVNRVQNLSLEILELLLQVNFVRIDCLENKKKREEFQKDAIIKLKMLGYISMVAENSN